MMKSINTDKNNAQFIHLNLWIYTIALWCALLYCSLAEAETFIKDNYPLNTYNKQVNSMSKGKNNIDPWVLINSIHGDQIHVYISEHHSNLIVSENNLFISINNQELIVQLPPLTELAAGQFYILPYNLDSNSVSAQQVPQPIESPNNSIQSPCILNKILTSTSHGANVNIQPLTSIMHEPSTPDLSPEEAGSEQLNSLSEKFNHSPDSSAPILDNILQHQPPLSPSLMTTAPSQLAWFLVPTVAIFTLSNLYTFFQSKKSSSQPNSEALLEPPVALPPLDLPIPDECLPLNGTKIKTLCAWTKQHADNDRFLMIVRTLKAVEKHFNNDSIPVITYAPYIRQAGVLTDCTSLTNSSPPPSGTRLIFMGTGMTDILETDDLDKQAKRLSALIGHWIKNQNDQPNAMNKIDDIGYQYLMLTFNLTSQYSFQKMQCFQSLQRNTSDNRSEITAMIKHITPLLRKITGYNGREHALNLKWYQQTILSMDSDSGYRVFPVISLTPGPSPIIDWKTRVFTAEGLQASSPLTNKSDSNCRMTIAIDGKRDLFEANCGTTLERCQVRSHFSETLEKHKISNILMTTAFYVDYYTNGKLNTELAVFQSGKQLAPAWTYPHQNNFGWFTYYNFSPTYSSFSVLNSLCPLP